MQTGLLADNLLDAFRARFGSFSSLSLNKTPATQAGDYLSKSNTALMQLIVVTFTKRSREPPAIAQCFRFFEQ